MATMKIGGYLAAVLSMSVLGGCATVGLSTPTGYSFINMTTQAQQALDSSGSSKTGEACTTSILGLYTFGDNSIDTAKKNGKMSRVASVDNKIFAINPFFGTVCTVVKGE